MKKPRTTDVILLWARAAGMCAYPNCKDRLAVVPTEDIDGFTVGQVAHITARNPGGPRADPANLLPNTYSNLILLCPTHHYQIDKCPKLFPADDVRAWKAEHEAWVRARTGPESTNIPWRAIVQDETRRIDWRTAAQALPNGNCVTEAVELHTDPARDGWTTAAAAERQIVERFLADAPADTRRFAVFSLGQIPLAVHLGNLLSARARAQLFHYDRYAATWAWPIAGGPIPQPARLQTKTARRISREAAIRVSLSARITPEDIAGIVRPTLDIEITVDQPSVRWLRYESQLQHLALLYEEALRRIGDHGSIQRVHLFYAGPAAAAVAFGREYNSRMHPPLVLYNYRRADSPCYEPVLTLSQTTLG